MSSTPELFALGDVCARLDGAGIAYMLTGSLAMGCYAKVGLAGVALRIVSAEDLILSKLCIG